MLFINYLIDCSEACLEDNIMMAEEYLVNVVQKGTKCKTFDELRVWKYHHSKCMLIEDLPPTSRSIRLHILHTRKEVFRAIDREC